MDTYKLMISSIVAAIAVLTFFAIVQDFSKPSAQGEALEPDGQQAVLPTGTTETSPADTDVSAPERKDGAAVAGEAEEKDDSAAQQSGSSSSGGAAQPSVSCSSLLDVTYYVDAHQTSTTQDDEVYVSVVNNNPTAVLFRATVNSILEGESSAASLQRANVISVTMTDWWVNQQLSGQEQFTVSIDAGSCGTAVKVFSIEHPSEYYLD